MARARVCREPNQPSDRMAGIVFRNCTTAGNVGDGFNINLHMLDLPCPGAQAPSKTAPCGRPKEVSAPACQRCDVSLEQQPSAMCLRLSPAAPELDLVAQRTQLSARPHAHGVSRRHGHVDCAVFT